MAQMHILLCKLVFVEMETLDEQALDRTALNYRMGSLFWDGHLESTEIDLE